MEDFRKNMSFDLRQRYRATSELIESVRGGKPLLILDAGSREGFLAGFLPGDRVVNLDRELFAGESFVAGDLLRLPFASRTFDLTVALDVMEHIEPGRRGDFLDEIARVSRDGFILGGPFYRKEVVEAERQANDFYIRATGRENEFLAEHLRLGLPRREEVASWMGRNNYRALTSLANNHLPLWLMMMGLSAYLSRFPRAEDLAAAVADLYDRHLASCDCLPPAYREIILATRTDVGETSGCVSPSPAPGEIRAGVRDFAEGVIRELTDHTGRVWEELRTETDRLREEVARLRVELQGIKTTVAYRLYQQTWVRIREIMKAAGSNRPSRDSA